MTLALGAGGILLMLIVVGWITFRQVSSFMDKIRAEEEARRREEEAAEAPNAEGLGKGLGEENDHNDLTEPEH